MARRTPSAGNLRTSEADTESVLLEARDEIHAAVTHFASRAIRFEHRAGGAPARMLFLASTSFFASVSTRENFISAELAAMVSVNLLGCLQTEGRSVLVRRRRWASVPARIKTVPLPGAVLGTVAGGGFIDFVRLRF